MHWTRRKAHIFTLVFLLHYCAFVVSPLTFNQTLKASDENIRAHKGSAVSGLNLNIFFWELLCYGLDKDRDIDDETSTVKILVKRPRAVLRNNITSVFTFFQSFAADRDYAQPVFYSSSRLPIERDEQIPHGEIGPVYSGLSPPLS